MKRNALRETALAAVVLLLAAGAAGATTGPTITPQSDDAVAQHVRHEILTYSHYTIWDNINYQVSNGAVVLSGAVTEPYKKSDLGKTVQHIPGVTSVSNQLEVLPLSPMDNGLRLRLARAIYRDSTLSRYAQGANPSIHIIVDNGRVTLEGVVLNQMDKEVAGLRAASAGLSFGPITNNLRIEMPAGRKG
jgi:hyperosmotically inducible protein